MTGLVVDGTGFEVLVGDERIGSRRVLGPADVELLEVLAAWYVRAVQARSDTSVFVELGRELYGWLEGDQGQLSVLLERVGSPLVFEVRGLRSPSDRAWAVPRAPFELLARPGGGCWQRMGWFVSVWRGDWAHLSSGRGRMSSGWVWRSWRPHPRTARA